MLSQNSTIYSLNFPAYPGLTQVAATCNVTINLPIDPTSINITKSDGDVNVTSYSAENLAAFTNMNASATFQLTSGYLQSTNITLLDRRITVSPAGTVTAIDTYHIKNTSPSSMSSFIFSLPIDASSVVIRDSVGTVLTVSELTSTSNSKLYKATFSSTITSGQLTTVTVKYSLSQAAMQGMTCTLSFNQFPCTNYYVDTATLTVILPEGAIFTSATPDSILSKTVTNYQVTLSTSQQGLSFVNYNLPTIATLQIVYDYNPVWVSYQPVIIIFAIIVIVCIVMLVWRKYKSYEKKHALVLKEKEVPVAKPAEPVEVTSDLLVNFTDLYDEKSQINSELTSLDAMAKKGKIQRQQYKAKKRELKTRYDSILRRIEESKQVFRNSGSANADLIKQLNNAEMDLLENEEKIKMIEARQESHQISIEDYKKSMVEYQRQREKIEAAISGILLRLREKAR